MLKLEPLARSHDRNGFDCGSEALNLFFNQTARQHAERGISRTFVLVDEESPSPIPVFGFFSLSLGSSPIPPNDFELFLPVKTIEDAVSESA